MKIAIPIDEKNEKTVMSDRFGRASFYLIYDDTNNAIELLENHAAQARGGAGIQASQFLISQEIKTVIAPEIGPNALRVLKSSNTKIYQGSKIPAIELIEKWKKNELKEI
jgi:predicted Fe-Mo cluster-binding NifX family protein